ncbi:hypothetical protein ACFFK0_14480 [Paenibacillus chartarius]|uniref:ABC transporter permease n=1 Tax=Paenibacillus chartarius TaxID=747481 RepID=A0ABV6DLX5_9BACL
MSVASYFIRKVPEIEPYKTFLMYILFFIAIKVLFELHYHQVLIVTLLGYIGFGLLQTLVVYACMALGLVTMEQMSQMGPANYLVVFVSMIVISGIVALMVRYRYGFSFISRHARFTYKSPDKIVAMFILASGVIALSILRTSDWIMMLALAVNFYLLLQFARHRELEDH